MTDDELRAPGAGDGPGGVDAAASRMTARMDAVLNRVGLRSVLARDCLLAVLVALLTGVLVWTVTGFLAGEGYRLSPAATTVFAVLMFAQPLMLCVRRRYPALCLVAVGVAHLGITAVLPPNVNAPAPAAFIAAYTCGALLAPRLLTGVLASLVALHGVAGPLVAGTLSGPAGEAATGRPAGPMEYTVLASGLLLMSLILYVGAALTGSYAATRRRYAELVRVRAGEAIQQHRERAEGAIRAERARMARELHDIAAHHLSGMVVQLGAAERLIGRDDQAAREAVSWVRSQGRETLDSLRLVVGALRDPGEDRPASGDGLAHSGAPGARGAPVPGAAALERLVAAERALGGSIDLVREGAAYDLPPVADVTVYRVAQEALSNAREHAPGAPVRVALHYRESRVVLEVGNDAGTGRPKENTKPPGVPRGLGLVGMKERAQLVGAGLAAGPDAGGGWRVRLDLPVTRETAARDRSTDQEAAQ
ncbi:sensor histidine kinase [Nocardiopsis sediminis]|uniref:histidine kinase n=1 Tax=Nocardiopsis sediminis TaxID=1778267 RepID=A0ABV8FKY3_9ACTN